MGTTLINSAFGFVFWTGAARTFDAGGVGLAAALTAAMTFISLIANVGIGTMFIEFLPSRTDPHRWSATVTAGLVAATVIALSLGLLTVFLAPGAVSSLAVLGQDRGLAVAFVVGVVTWTLATVLDFLCIAERRAGGMLARNLAFVALRLPLVALPLVTSLSASNGLFLAWVLATTVTVVAGLVVVPARLTPGWRPTLDGFSAETRGFLRATLTHHIINVGSQLPMFVLPIIVAARLTNADNAYFYSTWMVCNVFFVVSPAVAASLFAEGARLREDLDVKVRASLRLIAMLQLPPMLVFAAGGQLILSLFGSDYADAGYSLLLVLVVSAVPDAVTNIYVSAARVSGRRSSAAGLNVAMGLTSVGLTWVLLPSMGIVGAGVAWLAAQTLGSVYVGIDLARRRVRRPPVPALS